MIVFREQCLRFRQDRVWAAVPYVSLFVIYGIASWLTRAYYMGDTRDYVDSILAHSRDPSYSLWEFGHLVWRPLGWLGFRLLRPITSLSCGTDERCNVAVALIGLNWLAGLLALFFSYAFVRINCKRGWPALVVTLALLFSQSFLNFGHTGLSYIPGLAFLILGFVLSLKAGDFRVGKGLAAAAAGCALASAVLMWFLFALAIPGALLSPILLLGNDRLRRRVSLVAAIAFAGTIALVYGLVIAGLNISSPADLQHWIASSSHGLDPKFSKFGVERMVFGFARSWINMGSDGLLFKRFLLRDPFNPVSLADLFRLTLWKVGLFYIFLSAVFVKPLLSRREKGSLRLLLITIIPVLGFAVLWQGGDMERYLPLYPVLVLSAARTLEDFRRSTWPILLVLFFAVATVSNSVAMAKSNLDRADRETVSRLAEIGPSLKPLNVIVVVNEQDQFSSFSRNSLFHPLNRDKRLHFYYLVAVGTPQVASWREQFALVTLSTWHNHGDVWVSKRVFHSRPEADWNWAEGDDPRISWTDFYRFFSNLQTGPPNGNADDFILLLNSPENVATLKRIGQT